MSDHTFTMAFALYRQIMIHATGHLAKVLAVGVAASVVFGAASVGYGIKERLCRDEYPDNGTRFSAPARKKETRALLLAASRLSTNSVASADV